MNKKYALVTGASRGIGRAVANALAKEGYHLYITCKDSSSELELFKAGLEASYPISCTSFVGDISNYNFVQELFTHIPALDVLVNNAGISYIGLLSDMSIENWNLVMHTNLTSVFCTCKFSIPLMLSAGSGKIINISSVWGKVGASMEVAYSASKGGLNSFTKALAKELGPSNIQVNAIACGVIDTDMNRCLSSEDIEALRGEIPADRIGKAEEVGELVVNLIHGNNYLTGQVISFDGGWI